MRPCQRAAVIFAALVSGSSPAFAQDATPDH
jgi:hypothetical protein